MPSFPMLRAPGISNRGFGLLSNRSNNNGGSGSGGQPYYGNMAPLAAPMADGAAPPSGGGTEGGGTGVTPFRQSLDLSRYRDAVSAATFANMAPLPTSSVASAYGDPAQSAASRSAYVARQKVTANAQDPFGNGTGELRRDEDRSLANAAFKQQSDADAAVKRGQAGVYGATAQYGIPSEANARNATANATNATAAETKALTPEKVVGQRIQNQGAAYMAPMAPLIADAEIARKQAETAAIQQKTPAEVKAIEGNAGAGAEINRQKSGLIDEQQRLLNAKMANMSPAAAAPTNDPAAEFELKSKMFDFYKKNGMEGQAKSLFPDPSAGGGSAGGGGGGGGGSAVGNFFRTGIPLSGGGAAPAPPGTQTAAPVASPPRPPYRPGMPLSYGPKGERFYYDGNAWGPL